MLLIWSCHKGSYKALFDALESPVRDGLYDLDSHIQTNYKFTKSEATVIKAK
jgi:hypothetical protein